MKSWHFVLAWCLTCPAKFGAAHHCLAKLRPKCYVYENYTSTCLRKGLRNDYLKISKKGRSRKLKFGQKIKIWPKMKILAKNWKLVKNPKFGKWSKTIITSGTGIYNMVIVFWVMVSVEIYWSSMSINITVTSRHYLHPNCCQNFKKKIRLKTILNREMSPDCYGFSIFIQLGDRNCIYYIIYQDLH